MKTLVLVVMLVALLAMPAFAEWSAVNLHPSGSLASVATGVSADQQVGSVISMSGKYQASLWTGSSSNWVNFGYGEAYGVSNGKQVGKDNTFGPSLWSGTAESRITGWGGTLLAIHDNEKAGYSSGGACWWPSGPSSMIVLGPPPGPYGGGEAYSVYHGQQVGFSWVSGKHHACLWSGTPGSFVDLNPIGSTYSDGNDIHSGQQVGWVSMDSTAYASLWTGTAQSWVNLNPTGADSSQAWGVSSGIQVGFATFDTYPSRHAGLWRGTSESWLDLHAFLPPSIEYTYSKANDIYVSGEEIWIVGDVGVVRDHVERSQAMLWHYTEPIPEPSSLLALFSGTTGLFIFRRRRK